MQLLLAPLMGPFHLRYPRYNAVTLRELLAERRPEALALSPLEQGALASSAWQDTPEIALPLAVVPWALRRGLPVYGVHEPSPDPAAPEDFQRYAAEYPQFRTAWLEVEAVLRPLGPLLGERLELKRILEEVMPLLRVHQERREAVFGDGPASDWLRQRARLMAERVLGLPHERVALLASAEHFPFLRDALEGKVAWLEPVALPVSEESRVRSLLDYAFRGDHPDPESLLGQLRELTCAEARYHEANLLLAFDHPAEALMVLERASTGDFSQPYYLPGYLLARLGQLYDLAGRRDAARRAYRGVLALQYAPAEALEAAGKGLETPFRLSAA